MHGASEFYRKKLEPDIDTTIYSKVDGTNDVLIANNPDLLEIPSWVDSYKFSTAGTEGLFYC